MKTKCNLHEIDYLTLRMSIETHVAHFLKENNFRETLKAFEHEYGKPFADPPDESLQEIIEDRYNYKALNAQLKDLKVKAPLSEELQSIVRSQIGEWAVPYPQHPKLVTDAINGLVVSSCVVFCKNTPILFLSTSSLKLYVIDLSLNETIQELTCFIGKVVIKNIVRMHDHRLVLLGMNGKLYVCEYVYGEKLDITIAAEIQAHPRLIVDTKTLQHNGKTYVFTLGWDFLMRVFEVGADITPIAQYKLPTQGTSFDATVHAGRITLVVGLNESTLLSVLVLAENENDLVLLYKISLNDAQFTVSSFSPRCIAIQSLALGVPLIAVATSHEPYMRLIVVPLRETFPSANDSVPIERNQILKNLSTLSPQDKYSQPIICWKLPSNLMHNGVWVVGEDGAVRGIDLIQEKVITHHQKHNGRIKSFTLSDGILITCGTDKQVYQWV